MARNCPSCGRANDDDARFCSGCGAEIASSEPVPAAAPPAPASPAGQVPPAPPPAMAQGAGGPPRKGPSPALLIVIIVLVVAAAAAAAVFFFIMPAGSDGGGETTPTPVASSSSAAPTPSAGGFLAAAVGRQGNVLGTVTADGAVKELATTLGPQIFQIAYSPDGKRIACIAGDWKRPELSMLDVAQGTVQKVRIAKPALVAIDSMAWLGPQSLLVAGFTMTPKSQGEDAELLVYDPVAGDEQRPSTRWPGWARSRCSSPASR